VATQSRIAFAHRLVHRFLERRLAGGHGTDFRAHQPHAGDVEGLPLHVHCAHVNDAFHAETRADGRRRDPVLAGPGFRDDALFPETLRQQDLADRVVDLVGSGVQQVLALEVNFRAAELFGPALREIKRRRPADVVGEQIVEFRLERRVILGRGVGRGKFLQRSHQGFRNEHPAKLAEVAGGIGKRGSGSNFSGHGRAQSLAGHGGDQGEIWGESRQES
jgi:hypothetical protein